MPNPTAYLPGYSYSDWQTSNPDQPLPAHEVDNDFANIEIALTSTQAALAEVRRSDGMLKNGSVGPDQLSAALVFGFTVRGQWSDAGVEYLAADGVVVGTDFYKCREAHTSEVGNGPEDDADLWEFLFSVSTLGVADGAITEAKLGDGSVTVNKIGTGAVVEAKIGAGAVVEGKIGAEAVSTAKIADGAVTLAKQADIATSRVMGRITSGSGVQEELTGDQVTGLLRAATSSVTGVVQLASTLEAQTGTDTAKAVTSAGLAAVTATEGRKGLIELSTNAEALLGTDTARGVTPANLKHVLDTRFGQMKYIGEASPSGVASVAFTGLSAYRMLHLVGWLIPATDNVEMRLRSSANNGSSYDSGGSDYAWVHHYAIPAGAHGTVQDNADSEIVMGDPAGNAANGGLLVDMWLAQFNKTTHMIASGSLGGVPSGQDSVFWTFVGRRLSTTARNAFQLLFSSGNLTGHLVLTGWEG